jgi:hypothetical protein
MQIGVLQLIVLQTRRATAAWLWACAFAMQLTRQAESQSQAATAWRSCQQHSMRQRFVVCALGQL